MFPAQALAQEMLRRGWRVALSTDDRGLRYAGGFAAEVERRALSAATFSRGGVIARALAPIRMAGGALEALRWFRADRPACVAGFGGYPAFPALAAAWLLGLPRLIHEQNGVLGRVNRLFARHVGAVACGTWPLDNPPAGATLRAVGNPVRDAVRQAACVDYAPPDGGSARLAVFGGSQGASVFARFVPAALSSLPERQRARLRVVQQAREGEIKAVRAAYAQAGIAAQCAAFFDDMPDRIAQAHLVISRAGASSVAEIGVIGRPALLVPYAAAMDDHQSANARALAQAGAALVLPEGELTADLLAMHVARLLDAPATLRDMARAAKAEGRPEAAADLADLVETLAAGRPAP
jgi:UDP-N-acetylglucosamine--N-acetylmuramyl-(pentapeptide) pyrophosphoryl-undecaprenol N-acetylglucosamine transferase